MCGTSLIRDALTLTNSTHSLSLPLSLSSFCAHAPMQQEAIHTRREDDYRGGIRHSDLDPRRWNQCEASDLGKFSLSLSMRVCVCVCVWRYSNREYQENIKRRRKKYARAHLSPCEPRILPGKSGTEPSQTRITGAPWEPCWFMTSAVRSASRICVGGSMS
jgi:hypothetical protein